MYYFKFDPERKIEAHRFCAKKLWLVREKYINLITDISDNLINPNKAKEIRDALMLETCAIYDQAPATDGKAYQAAREALKIGQEMTFSDKEIDDFLPMSLRKIK